MLHGYELLHVQRALGCAPCCMHSCANLQHTRALSCGCEIIFFGLENQRSHTHKLILSSVHTEASHSTWFCRLWSISRSPFVYYSHRRTIRTKYKWVHSIKMEFNCSRTDKHSNPSTASKRFKTLFMSCRHIEPAVRCATNRPFSFHSHSHSNGNRIGRPVMNASRRQRRINHWKTTNFYSLLLCAETGNANFLTVLSRIAHATEVTKRNSINSKTNWNTKLYTIISQILIFSQ